MKTRGCSTSPITRGKPRTFKITKTYRTSIAGSRANQNGDWDDYGYDDEEGIEFPYTSEGLSDAARHLECEGVGEFNNWFSTIDPERDDITGAETFYDFHVVVVPEEPYKEIIYKKLNNLLNIQ